MNFPDKAVVVANNKDELFDLMLFFDHHNKAWPSGRPCMEVANSIWNNKNVRNKGDATAINLVNGSPDGYCWVDYYRRGGSRYLSGDPEWDFISVADFISKIDNSISQLSIEGLL